MSIEEIVDQALLEDIGDGDHTTLATIPAEITGKARLLIKEKGILCGVGVAKVVFSRVDPSLTVVTFMDDGTAVSPGDVAFIVSGYTRSVLQAERVVLNFMQRLSGIATATRKYAEQVAGTRTKILDTRKTTPLLRGLEKYAVRTGGGTNHRMGLYDMVMIKDNHVDFAGGIERAITSTMDYLERNQKRLKIEIEVRNFDELSRVMEFGHVDRIMLDNFCPSDLLKAVRIIDGRFETEASGGITLEKLPEYAATGVDFISVGALTHHIKSLDMSLKAC